MNLIRTFRRFRSRRLWLAALGCLLLAGQVGRPAAFAGTLLPPPPNFSDSLVVAVDQPTDLAWTPDGRMLITTQPGFLRIYQSGALIPTPALDLSALICDNSERGLLGVAVDPAFATNHYIYLFYTVNKHDSCETGDSPDRPVNRASRFTLGGNSVNPASELVLVDNILSVYGNHNAGDMAFGANGLLHISIGDGGGGGPADDLDKLAGKILRINADGTIPASNPFAGQAGSRRCGDPAGVPAGGGPCKEIFAYGLRNPFRMAFQPNSDAFYINDVGQDRWEEIDVGAAQGAPAANYGWPTREGPCDQFDTDDCGAPPAGMTNPLLSYEHDSGTGAITDGCSSITGGAFVPNGIWPAAYDGTYLFSDYVCGKIFRRAANGTLSEFVTGLGGSSIVNMAFGPYGATQALYYTNYYGTNGSGQVRRIAYAGVVNQAPNAVAGASPTYGPAPLAVTFSAAGSSDPNDDPLTFDWAFGDGGTALGGSAQSVNHTYVANGVYTATLTVRDNHGGASQPATLRIDVGNAPPQPSIDSPGPSAEFAVGQLLTLQGSASDPQDGALPGQSLRWQVILHHVDEATPGNAHTHPLLAPTAGAAVSLTAPQAEGLGATALSYVEIRLTATDSLGLSATITQTLNPHRVPLSFETAPDGLNVVLNSQTIATPRTLISWENYVVNVAAPVQVFGGQSWACQSWSDGGACAHAITTPDASGATYTATFGPALRVNLPLLRR